MPTNQKSEVARKPQNKGRRSTAHIAISHQGPLPMASEFAAYEQVLPGSANRIIGMAEKSLSSEMADMRSARRQDTFALVSGRLFLYALLAVSVFLVITDRPVAALLAGLAPIISVVYGTFKSSGRGK